MTKFKLNKTAILGIQRAARRGAAYLDKREGRDWFTRIDSKTLNINKWADCILGQLKFASKYTYGAFNTNITGVAETYISDEDLAKYGFTPCIEKYAGEPGFGGEYLEACSVIAKVLTKEWKSLIKQRRDKAKARKRQLQH